MRLLAIFVLAAGAAFAQPANVCNVSNAQTNGYVLTATTTGGKNCAWRAGSGGSGATNATATCSGSTTSCAVDITSLNLTTFNPALMQCHTATTIVAITGYSLTGSGPITTVTPTYSATSDVTCAVNSNGGAGPTGATGATGPAGANGTNGTNGAISRIQNAGSSLPVEPFLNFVNSGCVDNPGSTSTDCTVGGGSGITVTVIASLGTPTAGLYKAVTDSADGSCITGSGTQIILCQGDGAAWRPISISLAATSPSGGFAINYSTVPPTPDIVTSVVPRYTASNTFTGSDDFSGTTWIKPFKSVTSNPATAGEGRMFYNTVTHTPCYDDGTTCAAFGGGGQAISTGVAFCPGEGTYPCWGTGAIATTGGPAAANSLGVVGFRMINTAASLTIKKIALSGFSGTGKATVAVFDSSGNLVQQSATVNNACCTSAVVFTFATAAVITSPWYDIAFTAEDTSTFSTVPDSSFSAIFDGVDTSSAGLVFSFANPATQAGGIGTDITMPSTTGTPTLLTGTNGRLPIIAATTN